MRRAAILVAELVTFFLVTALMAYFISHAGALRFAPGQPPPAPFPVIALDGDRAKPEARNYRLLPWSEWETFAGTRPGASLLLPERSGTLQLGNNGEASFRVTAEADAKQAVELVWRRDGGEQEARYVAQARSLEPQYLRTLGNQTLLISAAVGFLTGLFAGRAMRRRWLAQPAPFVPSPPA